MKDDLARALLVKVMNYDDENDVARVLPRLQAMAAVKYDEYEGYQPGVKFLESLAAWLTGFAPNERAGALDFVETRLVFVSSAEMDRLISRVYPDLLRPMLIARTGARLGLPSWRVGQIVETVEFQSFQRHMIVLGMSDGARLDRLRRTTPLSTEQFYLSTDIPPEKIQDMRTELGSALRVQHLPGPDVFELVTVVDDFAASGTTMLRPKDGGWAGKLAKVHRKLEELKGAGHVSADVEVFVILYMATERALTYLEEALDESGLHTDFDLQVVFRMASDLALSLSQDGEFIELCKKYYKSEWASQHTAVGGEDFALGYGDCALPLVLHHNTPNNSVPVLWRDEVEEPVDSSDAVSDGQRWHALFPRHERHHKDRP
jgi:hypothetical protein